MQVSLAHVGLQQAGLTELDALAVSGDHPALGWGAAWDESTERRKRILTGGSTQVRLDDSDDLRAKLGTLREEASLLREACMHNQHTAVSAGQRSARILADCRRSRGEVLCAELPRDPTCGAVARRLVEEHLGTARAEEIADATTVVSELVNNAFMHGEGRIELRVSRRRGRARIEVRDEGKDATVRAGRRDRGHGLDIVDALSLAWGAGEGSTRVWAELPTGVRDDELPSLSATRCGAAAASR